MKKTKLYHIPLLMAFIAMAAATPSLAAINVQCPGDTDGDAIIDTPDPAHPNARCVHLSAGDGFVTMADGKPLYIFSFSDITGLFEAQVMDSAKLGASLPGSIVRADEGDELYLTLSNVTLAMRPDLADPHTVHFHGFPNAATILDGIPELSVAINMGASFTYYYNIVEPGTFLYHCHAEATEHMQMGMLGNLYIRPKQNRLPDGSVLGTHIHSNPDWNADRNLDDPENGDKYVYNDGDASTIYDVELALQMSSVDSDFHDASLAVQPLPFTDMRPTYALLNGRGYPDTAIGLPLPAPTDDTGAVLNNGRESQAEHSLLTADQGQRILLRLSNVSITKFFTLLSPSLPMTVIGKDTKLLRSTAGENLFYNTNSITLGGGETTEVILDTANVAPGRYFLYTSNLNYLANNQEDFGGMMTEIVINPTL